MPARDKVGAFLSGQLTPPARYGLVVLGLLLGVHFLRVFGGHVESGRENLMSLTSELAVLSDAGVEDVWAERARSAEADARSWAEQAWKAPAPGIGAAQLESAVRAKLAANGFDGLQLQVDPEPVKNGQLQFFRFNISGQLAPGRAHSLLAEMATSKPALHVTSLQFSGQIKQQFSVRIEGLGPYIEE